MYIYLCIHLYILIYIYIYIYMFMYMYMSGHASEYFNKPIWSDYRNGTQFGHGEIKILDKDQLE
jgi:hypothetical protein